MVSEVQALILKVEPDCIMLGDDTVFISEVLSKRTINKRDLVSVQIYKSGILYIHWIYLDRTKDIRECGTSFVHHQGRDEGPKIVSV